MRFSETLCLSCCGLVSPVQVLEGVIKYRWNALPVDQRDGMKNYISDVIVKVLLPCFCISCTYPLAFPKFRMFLTLFFSLMLSFPVMRILFEGKGCM